MASKLPLPEPASSFAGLAFKIWSQRFGHLWDWICRLQLQEDWRQEAATIALLLSQEYTLGDKEAVKEAYRMWYAFLTRYGFKRARSGEWKVEVPFSHCSEEKEFLYTVENS